MTDTVELKPWSLGGYAPVGDRVKPLEWVKDRSDSRQGETERWSAQSQLGRYSAYECYGKGWFETPTHYDFNARPAASIEEAKAAAQADYEQRILSALEPCTSPPEPASGLPTHRHKKRGTEYVLIGIGKMQAKDWWKVEFDQYGQHPVKRVNMVEVAIYRDVENWSLWARPLEEFEDGRFEPITAPPAKEPQ